MLTKMQIREIRETVGERQSRGCVFVVVLVARGRAYVCLRVCACLSLYHGNGFKETPFSALIRALIP